MATHFSVRVYGRVWGAAPYTNSAGTSTAFTRAVDMPNPGVASFPVNDTTFFPLPNGVIVGGAYVYSVIRYKPTGLNVPPEQYVVNESSAVLATLAG